MTLGERWLAFCKPYLDRQLNWAREDSDVTLAEYEEMKRKYDRMYK